jgi:prepilin-type N-terminal cleavage/methylation domain-containing protein
MRVQRSLRRGFTYVELLVAAILLGIAAAAGIAGWNLSVRAPANKRVTEMAVFIGIQELERMKAKKYLSVHESVIVQYYDKYGAPVGSAVTKGYKARSWSSALINRDGVTNTEDMRELRVEVWDNTETTRYESIQTLLTFGGL